MTKNKNLITLALLSTLAACNSDVDSTDPEQSTPAVISGDSSASINEDETAQLAGILHITDLDENEEIFVAQVNTQGGYGTFTLTTEGGWTYSLDNANGAVQALASNDTAIDTFLINSVDGTSHTVVITIVGLNDSATFTSGTNVDAATVQFNDNSVKTGTLTVTDVDDGENVLIEQASMHSSYGIFSISSDGLWQYTLDTANTEVANLTQTDPNLIDNIDVSSIDGTAHTITITIMGADTSTPEPDMGPLLKGAIGDNDSVPEITCTTTVNSTSALEDAASYEMEPGMTLCLAAGDYSGLDLEFGGQGTAEQPVTIAAAQPGSVTISGEVSVQMSGEFVTLQGFIFKDGSMDNTIIQTRGNSSVVCNNCRISEVSIINMDQGISDSTKWVYIYGANNRVDHSWFAGKTTRGALLVVDRYVAEGVDVDENFEVDRTQIDHNYFGDRPPIDGKAYPSSDDNEYEAIRLGTSDSHTGDSYSVVEHNYFERIQGEAEVISNKSGHNTISHNTIRDSYGSIVSRHGEYTDINNNFVIADDYPFSGGIRLVDANHSVTNNYIQGARYLASDWNGGIVLSSSDGSTTNGYQDVENVFIANNTIVDSVNSLNVYGGNKDSAPDGVYFVNNIIADAIGPVIRNADKLPTNAIYAGNYVYGNTLSDDDSVSDITGMTFVDVKLMADNQGIYRLSNASPSVIADNSADLGMFTLPIVDMDGQNRSNLTVAGADEVSEQAITRGLLNPSLIGPINYTAPAMAPMVAKVTINNHDFDSNDVTGWVNNLGEVTTLPDEVFSRGASLKLMGESALTTQTVEVLPNTNYTLSAFVKGVAKLAVVVNGMTYAVDEKSTGYKFTSVSFNSGVATSAEIKLLVDDSVENQAVIKNANFDDKQQDWVVVEGTGIGQVQDSSNSSTSTDNSIKFKYDLGKGDNGTPYNPYIAQTVTVEANTEYTLSMYNLLKSAHTGSTVKFGVFSEPVDGSDSDTLLNAATIIAFKDSVYANLEDAPEGEDSFKQDSLIFNSGEHTRVTIFAEYNSTTGDEIRVDEFSLSYKGAPSAETAAFFDSVRLVSHAKLEN